MDLSERLERVADSLGFSAAKVPDDVARSVESVVRFLVSHLVEIGQLVAADAGPASQALLARERTGSTGVGRGLGLPHAAVPFVQQVVGVLARCPAGVSWEAVDGQPVRLILLMLTPLGRPGENIRAMEMVAQALQDNSPA
jgi:mannitol/fructose-specific phosphotransferase system IIA component (Ntr-type)